MEATNNTPKTKTDTVWLSAKLEKLPEMPFSWSLATIYRLPKPVASEILYSYVPFLKERDFQLNYQIFNN